jgi:hypothetical protein
VVTDLDLGMLVVGSVALASGFIGVCAAALHMKRGASGHGMRATLVAACQAGVLTPFGLLLLGYVFAWADFSSAIYVAIGLAMFAASGVLLHTMRQNAASGPNASEP